MNSLINLLKALLPQPMVVMPREFWVSPIGAGIGLLATNWISVYFLGESNPWFIAPMGASAVLLFAAPASPLAQPWSIIGGNLIAATVAVVCQLYFGPTGTVASIAAALAIGIMMRCRCLHPPSGAVALTAVMGGPAITELGFRFIFAPVLLNSIVLLGVALLFNGFLKRNYPHRPVLTPSVNVPVHITHADVMTALRQQKEYLDIDEGDIESILHAAEGLAQKRQQQ